VIGLLAAVCIVAVLAAQAWAVSRLRQPEHDVDTVAGPAHGRAISAPAAAPGDPVGRLVHVLRRRRWLRRSLSFASVAVMLVAVGMIGYPFYTNLYADRLQDRLGRQLVTDELRQAYEDCRQVGLQASGCQIQDGDSLTRIRIPAIDIDVVVVEGVSASALRAGAGHYPSTPLPCESGNVSIAGHRTTYGRPFHNIDLLQPGDEIFLATPIGECRYEVTEQLITRPTDVSVIENTADSRLTLTTCHPKGSARQRLIVHAALVGPLTNPA